MKQPDPQLATIDFDDQDGGLFNVPDPQLRADALTHSLLPRLRVVLNEAVSLVREIYGLDALEDSTVSVFPHVRQTRQKELEHLYEYAFVGLGGRRVKNKWQGAARKDGKPVQILPFRLAFTLSARGLGIVLENYWLKGLTDEFHRKLFAFHLDHEPLIAMICFRSEVLPQLPYIGPGVRSLSPFRDQYLFMADNCLFDNHFLSREAAYPVGPRRLLELLRSYALFYPVYDAYLQMAKGGPERFGALVEKANAWLEAQDTAETQEAPKKGIAELMAAASLAAEQQVKVMPALRWQVFQRDGWKCLACGRGAHDGIILHTDHILPRSKGGNDTLDNLQTLCHECNLGKSNRDATDLRSQDPLDAGTS